MSQHSKLQSLWVFAVPILLLAILQPSFATAQNPSAETKSRQPTVSKPSAAGISLDEIKLKRSEVEASQNLDKANKDIAIKLLDQAIGFGELFNELNRQSEVL